MNTFWELLILESYVWASPDDKGWSVLKKTASRAPLMLFSLRLASKPANQAVHLLTKPRTEEIVQLSEGTQGLVVCAALPESG